MTGPNRLPARFREHGLVLPHDASRFDDLTKFGRIVIRHDDREGVVIEVTGFEFSESQSCRHSIVKAMAWGRAVLNTAVHADELVPGGRITSEAGREGFEGGEP